MTSETILYTITKFMISNKLQIKDHAAYQNNKYVSTKIQEEETNAQVQINILLSNAYKTQVDLLHFDDERCIKKKQQMYDQQSYKLVFVADQIYPCLS